MLALRFKGGSTPSDDALIRTRLTFERRKIHIADGKRTRFIKGIHRGAAELFYDLGGLE